MNVTTGEDEKSKKYFIDFLKGKEFLNITDTAVYEDGQFAAWDVAGSWHGQNYEFELKERSFSSEKFCDNTCEMHKLNVMCEHVASGKIKAGYIVSMFSDGKMCISSIRDSYTTSEKWCPKNTRFGGRANYVKKTLVHFPQTEKNMWDMATKKLVVSPK